MKARAARLLTWLKRWAEGASPIVALLLVGLVYFLGIRSERSGFVREVLDPGIKRITQPVLNAFKGKPPTVSRYHLDLSAGAMDSLLHLRDSALLAGYLDSDALPMVSAILRSDSDTTGITLGVLTRTVDHLRGDRWQMRLRSIPDNGRTHVWEVHVLDPVGMGITAGWLMHRAAEDAGLPTLDLHLADLSMNGKDLGSYAWAPLVDSTVLNDWGLPERPWATFQSVLRDQARLGAVRTPFLLAPLPQEHFSVAPIAQGPTTTRTPADRERELLKAMRTLQREPSKAAELLDIARTAQLLALTDIFGAHSALSWSEWHFVLDSAGTRLIPFLHAPRAGRPINSLAIRTPEVVHDPLMAAIFRSSEIRSAYFAHLERWSSGDRIERFLQQHMDTLNTMDLLLQIEQGDSVRTKRTVDHDKQVIARTLRPRNPAIGSIQQGMLGTVARVASLHQLPLEVTAIVQGTDTLRMETPYMLSPRLDDSPLDYLRIPLSAKAPLENVVIILQVPGTHFPLSVALKQASSLNADADM